MSATKYGFTWENIEKSPAEAGVYALYDGNEIIYIGRARGRTTTIRSRLADHKRGDEGPCTEYASAYWREVNTTPDSRERELLESYLQEHGRLPRCNDVMP